MFVLLLVFSIICGLSQFSNKAHIARAVLEAVCFQTREVFLNNSLCLMYICMFLINFYLKAEQWDKQIITSYSFGPIFTFHWSSLHILNKLIYFTCNAAAFLFVGILKRTKIKKKRVMRKERMEKVFKKRGISQWFVFFSLFFCQILDAMNQDSGIRLTKLQVDGGMTANNLLMQIQADLLNIPVSKWWWCPSYSW